MTDINQNTAIGDESDQPVGAAHASLSKNHERILTLMELFYFAYRDFTGDGDEVLEKIGFGRAHHRVIHFVHHYPGLRVAELLSILKITKQSLARVLKQLVDQGFIEQKPGKQDRRERLLFTTSKGRELAKKLAAPQIDRFENAVDELSKKQQQTVETFLFSLIQQGNRQDVISLMAQNGHRPDVTIKKEANGKAKASKSSAQRKADTISSYRKKLRKQKQIAPGQTKKTRD